MIQKSECKDCGNVWLLGNKREVFLKGNPVFCSSTLQMYMPLIAVYF